MPKPYPSGGAFVMSGDPMPTLSEVDEALRHLAAVPREQRGAAWHAYADAVLTERDFARMTGELTEELQDEQG